MRVFVLLLILFATNTVIAQHHDTVVYSACRLATDTETINGADDNPIFDSCPRFKHGVKELYRYISKNIRYPSKAKRKGIEGRVIVSVIVEKNGRISHPEIGRGIEHDLDIEALRVVNALPRWKPGILHGKPVRVKYVLVIGFKLPKATYRKGL